MVCRESSLSSAMITFARGASNLDDSLVSGLNHSLMREGNQLPDPTQSDWNNFIDSTISSLRSGDLVVLKGSRDPLSRLEAAKSEMPSGKRFYAAQRLLNRIHNTLLSHNSYLENYARSTGIAFRDAELEFTLMISEAGADTTLCASPSFVKAWESNPDYANLFIDRKSLYAYEQMEINRASLGEVHIDIRPAVTRTKVEDSIIETMGYDPLNGRFEVTSKKYPERIHAYRMSPTEYEGFLSAPGSIGARFKSMVQGNPLFQYGDIYEAEMASEHFRCELCGQFSGMIHECPPLGSQESLDNDVRMAVARATANVAGLSSPEELATPETLLGGRNRLYSSEYDGSTISLRLPSISRMTAEARRASAVRIPILATFDTGEGQVSISGLANLAYEGRGRGYFASPVAGQPNLSDNLKCNCSEYQVNLNCKHLSVVTERISNLARGASRPTMARVQQAVADVQVGLEEEYRDSVARTTVANIGWRPVNTSFENDPTIFQDIYQKFREKSQSYKEEAKNGSTTLEYPVPYIRENALGGLARRGSKRGFGTEIEFSFPTDITDAEKARRQKAIGLALYSAGLTPDDRQHTYGATHNRYTEEQNAGWSFEEDLTTSYGHEATSGGEIVSPVMFDEEETWINLEKVCNILKENGAITSKGAGFHVHVGVGDYDHRVENHNRLMQAYSENEDLLYRLSSNPERGTHRGQSHCQPNRVASTPYTTMDRAVGAQSNHADAINFEGVKGNNKDHVEFRTFDSTLNPGVIQAQIAFSVYMTEGATRPEGSTLPNENRMKLGTRRAVDSDRENLSGEDLNASTKPIRRFIDRFVPGNGMDDENNPRIQQLVALFAMTRWQANHKEQPK